MNAIAKRKDPQLIVLSASSETSNSSNAFETATATERWTTRVRLLGKAIAERWQEALGLKELVMNGEAYLTARQVWERLAISERHFFRLVRAKSIPCIRISSRLVRYRWSDVEEALGAKQSNAGRPA
jgi:predicted DNA-binding transcriptional regulator AlpA